MRITLHVGQHKTATSSIQHLLSSNSRNLARRGVAYPTPLLKRTAHHELAWAIKGWPLELLDPGARRHTVWDILAHYNREIHSRKSTLLLLSSEDLCLFTGDQWSTLIEHLRIFPWKTRIERLDLIFTIRPLREWSASVYQTLLGLGLPTTWAQTEPALARAWESQLVSLQEASTVDQGRVQVTYLNYQREEFLPEWFDRTLPGATIPRMLLRDVRANEGKWSWRQQQDLLEKNVAAGIQWDLDRVLSWPEFHSRESIERQRATSRFISTMPADNG